MSKWKLQLSLHALMMQGRQDGGVRHKEQRGAGTQVMGCRGREGRRGGDVRGQGRSMHLLAASL